MNIENKLQKIAYETWQWICAKYGINSDSPQIDCYKKYLPYVKRRNLFAGYVSNYDRIIIGIGLIPRYWLTYKRKGMGEYADCIPCKKSEIIALAFIHEFTHAIQSRQGRKCYETEPIKNEIEYAREFFPHLAERLVEINSKGQIVPRD